MADIFGRQEQVYGGGLTSDASWMFWAGLDNGGLGMLVTQMSIQYTQPIRRIFEIGPWTSDAAGNVGQPVYYVAGRPEGQLQIGRIAGPVAALGGFYKTYGNICSYLNSLFFVSSTGCIGGLPAGAAITGQPGGTTGGGAFGGTGPISRDSIANPNGRNDPYLGWFMNGVAITNLGLSAQAQEMLVNESVQLTFLSLRLFYSSTVSPLAGSATVGGSVTGSSFASGVWKEV